MTFEQYRKRFESSNPWRCAPVDYIKDCYRMDFVEQDNHVVCWHKDRYSLSWDKVPLDLSVLEEASKESADWNR